MSTSHDPDQQFHENLQAIGGRLTVPESAPSDLRSRCLDEFGSPDSSSPPSRLAILRKPALLSTLGLAACLAIAFGLLFPTNGGPTVQAATILEKFDKQLAEPKLLEVTLDSIVIDEISVDGQLQVANEGVAGDLHVVVSESADKPPIDIDLALAVGGDESWVLIRSLQLPDDDAQALVQWLFPPGVETLIVLPAETAEDLNVDLADELRELGSGELAQAFKKLVDAQSETGATITKRRNGTIVMTLPIDDTQALVDLIRVAAGEEKNLDELTEEVEAEFDEDELGLIGSTIEFVYDPETEVIRSFSVIGFGDADGTLSVVISGNDLDPAWLDPERVTSPTTRTLDLATLKSMFHSLEDVE
jgi:hypothetical protein